MCSSAKSVDRFTGLPRFAIHQYNWRQLTCVFLPLRRASISIISERVIERFFRSADRRGAGPKSGLERVANLPFYVHRDTDPARLAQRAVANHVGEHDGGEFALFLSAHF